MHASTLQIGNTKLLCHIHKGNNTCGHCEPGLLIKGSFNTKSVDSIILNTICNLKRYFLDDEPVQKTYQPKNLKALHKKELYRLKEKYNVKPVKTDGNGEVLLPEGYEDKAQIRRETVGSIHDAVKTEQASLET